MRLKRPHPIRAIKARLGTRAQKPVSNEVSQQFTVIYDFDGTLADTIDEALNIFNDIAKKRGYQSITSDNMQRLRGMGVREVTGELGIPPVMLPILFIQGKRRLSRVMHKIQPYAGITEMLSAIHAAGCAQAVATSNSLHNTRVFLEANTFPPFEYVETGIGIFGKARRFKRMFKKYKISPNRVVYVGDELRDIEAARAAGIKVISVTWGMNDKKSLRVARPDYVAQTPQDVVRIVTSLARGKR